MPRDLDTLTTWMLAHRAAPLFVIGVAPHGKVITQEAEGADRELLITALEWALAEYRRRHNKTSPCP